MHHRTMYIVVCMQNLLKQMPPSVALCHENVNIWFSKIATCVNDSGSLFTDLCLVSWLSFFRDSFWIRKWVHLKWILDSQLSWSWNDFFFIFLDSIFSFKKWWNVWAPNTERSKFECFAITVLCSIQYYVYIWAIRTCEPWTICPHVCLYTILRML